MTPRLPVIPALPFAAGPAAFALPLPLGGRLDFTLPPDLLARCVDDRFPDLARPHDSARRSWGARAAVVVDYLAVRGDRLRWDAEGPQDATAMAIAATMVALARGIVLPVVLGRAGLRDRAESPAAYVRSVTPGAAAAALYLATSAPPGIIIERALTYLVGVPGLADAALAHPWCPWTIVAHTVNDATRSSRDWTARLAPWHVRLLEVVTQSPRWMRNAAVGPTVLAWLEDAWGQARGLEGPLRGLAAAAAASAPPADGARWLARLLAREATAPLHVLAPDDRAPLVTTLTVALRAIAAQACATDQAARADAAERLADVTPDTLRPLLASALEPVRFAGVGLLGVLPRLEAANPGRTADVGTSRE